FARATGLFGFVDSNANNTTHLDAAVTGASLAKVTAGPRDLGIASTTWDSANPTLANIGSYDHLAFAIDMTNGSISPRHHSDSSKRSLAAGGDNGDGTGDAITDPLTFNSDVLILSGRSPTLEVDQDGKVSTAVNIRVNGVLNPAVGSSAVSGGVIHVNDITNQ